MNEAVIKLGERESHQEDYEWPDIADTDIQWITIFDALALSDNQLPEVIIKRFAVASGKSRWIHLDMDILDTGEMAAVDCSATPGLPSERLIYLCRALFGYVRGCGIMVTIYDPDKDPDGTAADLAAHIIVSITGDF